MTSLYQFINYITIFFIQHHRICYYFFQINNPRPIFAVSATYGYYKLTECENNMKRREMQCGILEYIRLTSVTP